MKLWKNVGGLHLSETIFAMLQLQSTPVISCGDGDAHDTRSQMLRPMPVLSADFPEIHEGLTLQRMHSVNQFVLHQIKRSTEGPHHSLMYHSSLPALPLHQGCPHMFEDKLNSQLLSQAGRYQNHPPKPKQWFIHVRLRFRTPLRPIEPCPKLDKRQKRVHMINFES